MKLVLVPYTLDDIAYDAAEGLLRVGVRIGENAANLANRVNKFCDERGVPFAVAICTDAARGALAATADDALAEVARCEARLKEFDDQRAVAEDSRWARTLPDRVFDAWLLKFRPAREHAVEALVAARHAAATFLRRERAELDALRKKTVHLAEVNRLASTDDLTTIAGLLRLGREARDAAPSREAKALAVYHEAAGTRDQGLLTKYISRGRRMVDAEEAEPPPASKAEAQLLRLCEVATSTDLERVAALITRGLAAEAAPVTAVPPSRLYPELTAEELRRLVKLGRQVDRARPRLGQLGLSEWVLLAAFVRGLAGKVLDGELLEAYRATRELLPDAYIARAAPMTADRSPTPYDAALTRAYLGEVTT